MERLKKFFRDEEAATAVEYALMAALIATVVIAAVTILGTNLNNLYQTAASEVGKAGS